VLCRERPQTGTRHKGRLSAPFPQPVTLIAPERLRHSRFVELLGKGGAALFSSGNEDSGIGRITDGARFVTIAQAQSSTVRVLFCIPSLSGGGAEKIAAQVATHLDQSRFNVTLFAHDRAGRFVGSFENGVRLVYASDKPYTRWRLPLLLLKTANLVWNSDIVVGANEGRATVLSFLCAAAFRKKFVSWIHCDWSEFGKYTSWRARLGLRVSAWGDAVVAVSAGAGAAFRRLVQVNRHKLIIIPNGIETEKTRRLAHQEVTTEHLELFRSPTIVAVGRLCEQKNHQLLIRTHAAIMRSGVFHRLLILGEGHLLGHLRALAAELGVPDTVHFLGFKSNPYPYMRHAAVFALTSLFEGAGIVLIEAMATGAPTVAVDCPSGPAEVLGGGRFGVLVPRHDDAKLRDALVAVLTNPQYRSNLSRLALEGAARFDLGQTIASWEELLLRLFSGQSPVPLVHEQG